MLTSVTYVQIRKFHAQLRELGLDTEMKRSLVEDVSEGRTTHSKELTFDEMRELINHLDERVRSSKSQSYFSFLAGDQQRKRIMSICHQLPLELGFTRWDDAAGRRVVNMERLNSFLTGPKSIFKKSLNKHKPSELSKVIVQFENMLNSYLNRR